MILNGKKITDIDLEFAKEYLKVDYNDEDVMINTLIFAAKSYINTMLGYKVEEQFNYADIPDELTIACLLILAHWFDNRQMQRTGTLGTEMAFAVSAIVNAHADPFKEGWVVDEVIPGQNQ